MSADEFVDDAFPPSPEERRVADENRAALVAAGYPDADAEKRAKQAERTKRFRKRLAEGNFVSTWGDDAKDDKAA